MKVKEEQVKTNQPSIKQETDRNRVIQSKLFNSGDQKYVQMRFDRDMYSKEALESRKKIIRKFRGYSLSSKRYKLKREDPWSSFSDENQSELISESARCSRRSKSSESEKTQVRQTRRAIQSENSQSSLGVYDADSRSNDSEAAASEHKSAWSASTVVDCNCNGKVTDKNMCIACDRCNTWFHRKCSNLLVKHWKFFRKETDFKWFCKPCV